MHGRWSVFAALGVGLALGVMESPARGVDVDLRLRSAAGSTSVTACAIGSTVSIQLHVISNTTESQPIAAISAILNWDPTKLRLIGVLDDAASPYNFLFNGFPDDRGIDRYNDDRANNLFWSEQECILDAHCSALAGCFADVACTNDGDCRPETFCNLEVSCAPGYGCCDKSYCNHTGFPFNDGNAVYQAWSQICLNPPCVDCVGSGPACAFQGPNGLLVTKFIFETLTTGSSAVSLLATPVGSNTETTVFDGNAPNNRILDQIGGPVTVTVGSVPVPIVAPEGPRWFRATPNNGTVQVALKVIGQGTGMSCINHYVNAAGGLQTLPVFRTGAQWSTIRIGDDRIIPGGTYRVESDCGAGTTFGATVTTYPWADFDNSGVVDIDDLIIELDAFAGLVSVYLADLLPCETVPGFQIVDIDDVIGILDAFAGVPYSTYCGTTCP